jgi:hypothetical protein
MFRINILINNDIKGGIKEALLWEKVCRCWHIHMDNAYWKPFTTIEVVGDIQTCFDKDCNILISN